ncbi:MAG: branched-chain amino acid ABC transporter permease [Scrofimicrobium sp.]
MLMTVLNGVTYAGLLFIIAVGLALVFGVLRVVNMSHGVMYLGAAYIALTVLRISDSWVLGVTAACVAGAIAAILLNYVVATVKGDMPQTLLTLGITLAVSDLCLWIWGGLPTRIDPPSVLAQPVSIFGISYPGFRIFMFGVALVVGFVLWYVMSRTQLGRLLRAGVDDREMLGALGFNSRTLFVSAFVISGVLIGLAGAVGGSYLAFGPGTEFSMLTLALVVVIIGGMGSIPGAAVGALIVGLVDSFGRTYLGDLSSFLLMGTLVIVLAVRPQGLFQEVR